MCVCVQNPEAAGGQLRVDVEKAVVARERSVWLGSRNPQSEPEQAAGRGQYPWHPPPVRRARSAGRCLPSAALAPQG